MNQRHLQAVRLTLSMQSGIKSAQRYLSVCEILDQRISVIEPLIDHV